MKLKTERVRVTSWIKLMHWNYRGWGWPEFASQFNLLCILNILDVFGFVEPKSDLNRGIWPLFMLECF